MEMIAYQPELNPALPVVVGNIDYHQYRSTLERIDQLVRDAARTLLKAIVLIRKRGQCMEDRELHDHSNKPPSFLT